jgi:uroporphyrinogen-III synthase
MNKTHPLIITGSVDSSLSLMSDLGVKGFYVCSFPMIHVTRCQPTEQIASVISHISEFSCLMFTSKYGVSSFFDSLFELTQSYAIPAHMHIACVGEKTAAVLAKYNHVAQYISTKNNGKDFAKELSNLYSEPISFLFPTGNLTQNMIQLNVPEYITITKIIVYHTNRPASYNPNVLKHIQNNTYHSIVFTSPSGVTNFVWFFKELLSFETLRVVSIGPTTTLRLTEAGFANIIQAAEYNAEGIVTAIVDNN